MAAAFDVAEARALARQSALPRGGALPGAVGAPPPALLLAVGGLAEIAADPALASRLRDLCARGPRAGVYVVATTDDVAAVVAAGQGERRDE